ncbi:MAG: hypothetical protein KDI55_02310 [Anaerolineae bacterium]|nr:hypothetical protein [Anaerolineae bacterium]MCP5428570.1 hypothetical protein [Chromatiaceae bacterium]
MIKRKRWLYAELQHLLRDYPDTPTKILARRFNCSDIAIYSKARALGLRKSEAYLPVLRRVD